MAKSKTKKVGIEAFLDTTGLRSGITRYISALNEINKATKGASRKNAASWRKFAAGMLIAQIVLPPIIDYMKSAAKVSMEWMGEMGKLNQVLKNTGRWTSTIGFEMEIMSKRMSSATGFMAQDILHLQTVFSSMKNIPTEMIEPLTRTTLNLSRAIGVNLNSAAKALGVALQDPINGMFFLRRLGITLNNVQRETIKLFEEEGRVLEMQAYTLDIVAESVEGVADAYGNTLPGKMERANAVLTQSKQIIGENWALLLEPLLTGFIEGQAKAVEYSHALEMLNLVYDEGKYLTGDYTREKQRLKKVMTGMTSVTLAEKLGWESAADAIDRYMIELEELNPELAEHIKIANDMVEKNEEWVAQGERAVVGIKLWTKAAEEAKDTSIEYQNAIRELTIQSTDMTAEAYDSNTALELMAEAYARNLITVEDMSTAVEEYRDNVLALTPAEREWLNVNIALADQLTETEEKVKTAVVAWSNMTLAINKDTKESELLGLALQGLLPLLDDGTITGDAWKTSLEGIALQYGLTVEQGNLFADNFETIYGWMERFPEMGLQTNEVLTYLMDTVDEGSNVSLPGLVVALGLVDQAIFDNATGFITSNELVAGSVMTTTETFEEFAQRVLKEKFGGAIIDVADLAKTEFSEIGKDATGMGTAVQGGTQPAVDVMDELDSSIVSTHDSAKELYAWSLTHEIVIRVRYVVTGGGGIPSGGTTTKYGTGTSAPGSIYVPSVGNVIQTQYGMDELIPTGYPNDSYRAILDLTSGERLTVLNKAQQRAQESAFAKLTNSFRTMGEMAYGSGRGDQVNTEYNYNIEASYRNMQSEQSLAEDIQLLQMLQGA